MSYMPFPDNSYAYNYPVRANNSYGLSVASLYSCRAWPMELLSPHSRRGSRRLFRPNPVQRNYSSYPSLKTQRSTTFL